MVSLFPECGFCVLTRPLIFIPPAIYDYIFKVQFVVLKQRPLYLHILYMYVRTKTLSGLPLPISRVGTFPGVPIGLCMLLQLGFLVEALSTEYAVIQMTLLMDNTHVVPVAVTVSKCLLTKEAFEATILELVG